MNHINSKTDNCLHNFAKSTRTKDRFPNLEIFRVGSLLNRQPMWPGWHKVRITICYKILYIYHDCEEIWRFISPWKIIFPLMLFHPKWGRGWSRGYMTEIVQPRQTLFMKYRNQSNQTDYLADQQIFALWYYNVQSETSMLFMSLVQCTFIVLIMKLKKPNS